MTHDPLDQLRAELVAIDPSPAFATGVRSRIDARSGAGFRVRFALATATLAIAAVAGGGYWLQRGSAVGPAPTSAVAERVPVPAAEPVVTPAPTVQPTRRARAAKPVAGAVAAAAPAGPFLEVITNQPEVIRRMRARFSTKAFLDPTYVVDTTITVAPIEVPEVPVPEIGGPVIRKGAQGRSADDSVRTTR